VYGVREESRVTNYLTEVAVQYASEVEIHRDVDEEEAGEEGTKAPITQSPRLRSVTVHYVLQANLGQWLLYGLNASWRLCDGMTRRK
jgi:hypothetical protein